MTVLIAVLISVCDKFKISYLGRLGVLIYSVRRNAFVSCIVQSLDLERILAVLVSFCDVFGIALCADLCDLAVFLSVFFCFERLCIIVGLALEKLNGH